MPEFVEFSREDSRSRRDDPQFTLQARGLLSFNQAAFLALGEPEAVSLLYDANEGIIGLRKVEKANPNGYQVRKQQKSQSYIVGAQGFTAYHGIQTLRARRFAGHDYRDGVWGFVLREGVPVTNRRGAQHSPATTGRWTQTTDGSKVAALMRIGDVAMSHPSRFRLPNDTPPSMRVGMLVACEPLGADPPTSELRSRFLSLLQRQPITDLVEAVSHIEHGALWTPYAGRGRINHEAVLTAKNIQDEDAPVASALLLLTDVGTSSFGRDPRFAELVLDIDLRKPDGEPAAPATLEAWHDRFVQMFNLPGFFTQFLTEDLDITTSAAPAAQLGVWLKTQHTMLELVDIGDLSTLPGSQPSPWFIGYSFANPLGQRPALAAAELLQQMCDYTLHVDKYEPLLAQFASHEST